MPVPVRLLVLLTFALAARPAVAQDGAEVPALVATAETPVASARPAVATPRPYEPSDRFDRPLAPEVAPAYYVVRRDEPIRTFPDERGRVMDHVRVRTGVRVLAVEGPWALVALGHARGYMELGALSNVWLRFDKSDRLFYVYRGAELLRVLPADVSTSDENKSRRSRLGAQDEYRTPEGVYFVARRHPRSEYHLAFILNYPNASDAERGLREGLITHAQYAEIVKAEIEGREPPMGTLLGGLIAIHGHGSGRQRAWTRGCIALRNVHMDWLWEFVPVGAPIVIER